MADIPEEGAVYYATAERYVEEAARSATSLKRHGDIHTTLFTTVDGVPAVFDNVQRIDEGESPWIHRIEQLKRTPYDRTLYLDTDTFVTGNIEPLFDLLDRFDIAAALDQVRDTSYGEVDIDVPEPFPEYNCGVILYRNTPAVMDMMDDWQEGYARHRDADVKDQPFFRQAVYESDLQICTLPTEYDLQYGKPNFLQQEARILHGRFEMVTTPLLSRGYTFEDMVERINRDAPLRRVIRPKWGKMRVRTGEPSVLDQILRGTRKYGATEALKRGIRKVFSINRE
ncbi:MAG: putative nucleotide-diphospho-sugar transferase [Candidatus Nanohaloarchaea archaeon]|nr:putative nucleotide-diphospho-sugar transferase [Candidatus Nanohaloarchaea archaeon]